MEKHKKITHENLILNTSPHINPLNYIWMYSNTYTKNDKD